MRASEEIYWGGEQSPPFLYGNEAMAGMVNTCYDLMISGGVKLAGEASEAAKVPEMGAEPTVNQAPRLMQPFNIFIKPNRQPAPRDAIIGAEWEHWSPAQQWLNYWQPNLPDHWSNSVNLKR